MSPRRLLLPALLLAAAAGPASAFLAEGHGGVALLLPVLVFAAAAAQGLPDALRLPPSALRSGSRTVRALRWGLALGVLLGILAGSRHAPFLAALLPAGLRGLRLPRDVRDLRTLRDALLAGVGYLALEGSGAALLSAAAVVLLIAALLPVIHAEHAARSAGEEEPAPAAVATGRGLRTALWAVPATALLAALLYVALPRMSAGSGREPSSPGARTRRIPDGAGGGSGDASEGPAAVPVKQVHIGDIGRLQRDLRPLLEMSVTREGRPADAEEFGPLLRSGALEEFDGVSWSSADRRYVRLDDGSDARTDGWTSLPRRRPPAPPAGEAVEQEFLFLAGGSDAIFALGVPVAVGGPGVARGVLAFARGEVRAAEALAERDVVRVRSVVGSGAYPLLDDEVLHRSREESLLSLPPDHERTATLAREILRGAPPGDGTLRILEAWLSARCVYSLDLPESVEGPPVEAFLFSSRRGHCELFASSAVVMLRAAGVPARMAIGFRGGVLDPVTLRYTFRGADAHAWVEAWFEDRGWVTFDPTPAPGGGAERDLPEEGEDGGEGGLGRWLDGVLRFDGAAQSRLLLSAAEGVRRSAARVVLREDGSLRWPSVLALAAALALLAAARLLRPRRPDAATAPAGAPPSPLPPPEAYAILLQRCAAGGVPRLPAETGREHAGRALALGFAPAAALEGVVASYEEERWGGRPPEAGERVRLRDLAERIVKGGGEAGTFPTNQLTPSPPS